MKLKNAEKNKCILAAISACLMATLFIIRAAVSGITYDEAFTYLAYARPLEECPTIGMVENIYWGCVANNHWLNTVLIALTGRITGIDYCEFLIRLPSVFLGCCYLFVTWYCYKRKKINGSEFIFLSFCYYMHEFFGLARGYGMATTLVLFGILLYREWVQSNCEKHWLLLASIGFLILSAYGNSVTLVVCFCLGVTMLCHLVMQKQLLVFFRKSWAALIILGSMFFLIVKYHFRISGEGMGLWAAESTSLFNLTAEYVSMLFATDLLIAIVSILLLTASATSFLYLIIRHKILQCDLGVSSILYFICLLAMDAVFGRGGFYGRTLLPAYPLVALGTCQLLSQAWQEWRIHHQTISVLTLRIVVGALIAAAVLSYVSKIDLLRTRDWYDDYNVKIDFYNNPQFETNQEHASVVFYEEKRLWDLKNLFEEYRGEEMNNYELQ